MYYFGGYGGIASEPTPLFYSFTATIAGLAFIWNDLRDHSALRRQTIQLVIDTRLSSVFQDHLANRELHFPAGSPVDPKKFRTFSASRRSDSLSDGDALAMRESANAVRSLLNYYEFIALGIDTGDLHEEMLKGSIRGIMCNLVRDAHPLLVDIRADNPRAYEHLATLYERWRDTDFPSLA